MCASPSKTLVETLFGKLITTSLMAFLLNACGSGDTFSNFDGSGGLGATPGGVKDVQLARETIKNGRVPAPEAFIVEGMFSEHDLPLSGAACTRTLCLRGALGVAPTLTGESSGWLQVGMSSAVNPDTYIRPALTAIFTVDVSGSMGWEYRGSDSVYPSAGAVADRLLRAIAAQLGPDDRAAIVTYGSTSEVALAPVVGNNPMLIATIDSLHTSGSTNMEAGLNAAYALARSEVNRGRQVRLFLFTDEQPNVGATSPSQFDTIVRNGAAEGASLTIFGLGLGLSARLMDAMAHLRGGNAFSLTRLDQVPTLMQESWPYMASPIAYDLKVALTPSSGFIVADSYGFPGASGASATADPKLDVSSVFLSKKRGALLVRFRNSTAPSLTGLRVTGSLDYSALDGSPIHDALDVNYGGEPLDMRGMYFPQPALGSTVALAILMSNMRQAATLYQTNHAQAVELMTAVTARISADRDSLSDPSLAVEAQLAADLLALMKSNASQDSFYGR